MRLYQHGFELNSQAAGMEFTGTPAGANTSNVQARTGTYSGRLNSLASTTRKFFEQQFLAAAGNGPYFIRSYVYFVTLPSAENFFFALYNSGTTFSAGISIDAGGLLRLYNGSASVVGSPSSALSLNTWYMVEMWYDRSPAGGSQILKARLEGVEFAAATNLTITNQVMRLALGGNLNGEAQTTGDWYFDDVAINNSVTTDSNGVTTTQTSYPGSGKIALYLRPSADGDNHGLATQVGGTAGAANNFTRMDETPTPNDVTDYNGDTTLNATDDYNIDNTSGGIGASDVINVVAVNVRYAGAAASANSGFKVRIKKAASGTVFESAEITPATATWVTNANLNPFIPPILLVADPDGAAWSKSTLDSAQIGARISTSAANAAYVSCMWVSVDYTPAAGAAFIARPSPVMNQAVNRASRY